MVGGGWPGWISGLALLWAVFLLFLRFEELAIFDRHSQGDARAHFLCEEKGLFIPRAFVITATSMRQTTWEESDLAVSYVTPTGPEPRKK